MLSTVPTQKQITLTSSADWLEWFVATKTYAQILKIWHLVDPDITLATGQTKPTLAPEGVYPTLQWSSQALFNCQTLMPSRRLTFITCWRNINTLSPNENVN